MRRSRRLLCSAVLILLGCLPLAAAEIPVSGRVRDSGGAALAGARVELRPILSSWEQGSRELDGRPAEPAAVTFTGPDGRFEVGAPGEGMWEVGVVAEGYVPQRYRLTPLTGPETLFPVRLRLRRDAGLRVRVEGPDGRPIPGARVIGRTWRDEHPEPGWQTAPRIGVSGADGVARVPGSREESLVLLGTAPGFPMQEGPEARGPGEVVFRLAPGTPRRVEAPRDAVLRDLQTSLVVGRGGSRIVIRGESWLLLLETREGIQVRFAVPEKGEAARVEVPAPAPLPGSVIDTAARQPVAGAWVWPRRDPGRFVRTDEKGTYLIQGDSLEVAAAGHLPEVVDSWSFRPEGGLPAVALEPEAFLSGTVEDMEGKPAAGAEVGVFPGLDGWFPSSLIPWPPRVARVAADGKVRIGGLRPGTPVQVMVMSPGFAPVWLDRGRLEARNNRFVAMLPRGGGVRGRLEDGEGKPVPEARIRIEPAAGTAGVWPVMDPAREKERFTVSAPDGGFAFADLPPGWYDLTVRRPGAAPQRLPRFEVKEGTADLGALRMEEAEVLAARVVDAEGRPVAGAEVWASVLSDPLVLHERSEDGPAAESGADGGVSLRASRWHGLELTVCAPGFVPQAVSVPRFLPEEPLVVTLQRGAAVSGRLTGAGGPVSGRVMQVALVGKSAAPPLLHECGGQGWNTTDEAGRFRVGGLEPGLYTVDYEHQVALAAGESRELALREEPRTVPGASFSGRLLGSDGRPIPGAVVGLSASETHGRFVTFDEARSRTDADGSYRLSFSRPGLEIDEMSLGISRHGRGLLTRAFSSWEGPARTEADGRIDIAVENHPMRLASEGPAELANQGSGPQPTASISGRILGLAPGELVKVSAGSSGEWMAGSVDAQGSYRLEGLQPETWSIRAEAADRTLYETVHIPQGEARIARDLAFLPVAAVSGRVADSRNQPIAGARVRLRHHAFPFETRRPDVETRTASDGRFEVRVPEGSYEATASKEGFVSGEDGSVDVDGDGAKADFWLGPAAELRGRLTGLPPDEDELAIEATLVDGVPGYHKRYPGRMVAEGRYVIPGLGPGTWEVEAACNGGDTGELEAIARVEIPEEATEAVLDLALARTGTDSHGLSRTVPQVRVRPCESV